MPIRVLFDTNILGPIAYADIVLSLADRELFTPLWSPDILDEVRRFGNKRMVPESSIEKRIAIMTEYFPDGLVRNYQSIIPTLDCKDLDDRHVLAAAIVGNASILVSENIKDFPLSTEEDYGIEVLRLDDFLELQFTLAPEIVCIAIALKLKRMKNPSFTVSEYASKLKINLPKFSQLLNIHYSDIDFHMTVIDEP
jgi:predicted nucleic acid-binding protein